MCGILGEINFGSTATNRQLFATMLDVLAPRGPDGEGTFFGERISFGHRRLSIIDLSERSAQPMKDPELGLMIIFNGEIYNYRELKVELLELGHRFHTESDTEVIMKAYRSWGADCLLRFRGMFAFAIWDEKAQSVFLARDPMGIK
ncbi:MAG: hypothetical protein M3Q07_22600, partial [Pseudobdellovibrionaceae bacterium]|nr:hypothetical protein [Pseudobdellovibrionaceae bacterium]